MGGSAIASNGYSTAMGLDVTASGYISAAIGNQTTASGKYSTAIGRWVTAGTAANTIAIGKGVGDSNRLVNNTANSLMVGFDRTAPTLFVSSASVSIDNTSTTAGLNVSTINAVSQLNFADGTSQATASSADNLGDHTAAQNLDMATFNMVNISTNNYNLANQLALLDTGVTNAQATADAALPKSGGTMTGELNVGTMSTVGQINFADGTSQITAASADNLGDHIAAKDLVMSSFNIVG